jgi:hypothetical protein
VVTMARSISSSSRKEVITDVVTTTLQKTTSRLIPAHSNAFFVSDFHRTSRVGQACNKLLDSRRGAGSSRYPRRSFKEVKSILSRYIPNGLRSVCQGVSEWIKLVLASSI